MIYVIHECFSVAGKLITKEVVAVLTNHSLAQDLVQQLDANVHERLKYASEEASIVYSLGSMTHYIHPEIIKLLQ